jgi:hypothetical protein
VLQTKLTAVGGWKGTDADEALDFAEAVERHVQYVVRWCPPHHEKACFDEINRSISTSVKLTPERAATVKLWVKESWWNNREKLQICRRPHGGLGTFNISSSAAESDNNALKKEVQRAGTTGNLVHGTVAKEKKTETKKRRRDIANLSKTVMLDAHGLSGQLSPRAIQLVSAEPHFGSWHISNVTSSTVDAVQFVIAKLSPTTNTSGGSSKKKKKKKANAATKTFSHLDADVCPVTATLRLAPTTVSISKDIDGVMRARCSNLTCNIEGVPCCCLRKLFPGKLTAQDFHPRFRLNRELVPLTVVRDDEGAFHVPALDEEMRYMGVAIDGKLFWDGRDASKRVAELMQEAAGGFAAGVAEVAAPEPVYLGEPVGPTAGPAFDQLEVFNGLLDEEGEEEEDALNTRHRRDAISTAEYNVNEHFKWLDSEGLAMDATSYSLFGAELADAIAAVTTAQQARFAASRMALAGNAIASQVLPTSLGDSALDGAVGFRETRQRTHLRHAARF